MERGPTDRTQQLVVAACGEISGNSIGLDDLLVNTLDSLELSELLHRLNIDLTYSPTDPSLDSLTPRRLAEYVASGERTVATEEVELRPVTPSVMDWLQELVAEPRTSFRWRLRGRTPPFYELGPLTLDRALAPMVVWNCTRGPTGILVDYNVDLQSQNAYVAAAFHGESNSGEVVRSVSLYVGYLFAMWPFRKIYFEIPHFNMTLSRFSESRLFLKEGELHEHEFYDGQWWNTSILAIHRTTFETHSLQTRVTDGPGQVGRKVARTGLS